MPIGLYIGVNRTGATSGGPYGTWWVLVTLPLATAGATAICVSLARAWWRGEGVGGWMVPMLATTILYGLAFWIGTASSVYVWFSKPSEYLILATRAAWTGPLAVAAVLGCVFAWRLRGTTVSRIPPLIVLLSAGAAAAATCTVRLRTVSPIEADEKAAVQLLDMWSAAG